MIKLLGIPYDGNSSFLRGPALAPARIRLMDAEGSANRFAEDGSAIIAGDTFIDAGDLTFYEQQPEKVYHQIKKAVGDILGNGHSLLCLGGDHSVSFPIIEAHAERWEVLHVLHLDAHADLYHDFDGNPFSHASPFARLMETGKVKSLTQVGIRTLTNHQREQASKFNVTCIEARDFNLAFLPKLKGPLYLSLDVDVLDPAHAPGVSHHEPGGLTTRQVLDVIQQLNVPLVGADIVEYNPVRDIHNITAMVAYKFMKELMACLLQTGHKH
jgi:arginase